MSAVNQITDAVLRAAREAAGESNASEIDAVGGMVIAASTVVGLADPAVLELARRMGHIDGSTGALSRAILVLAELYAVDLDVDAGQGATS